MPMLQALEVEILRLLEAQRLRPVARVELVLGRKQLVEDVEVAAVELLEPPAGQLDVGVGHPDPPPRN
jgi:hypothetical protein